MNALAEEVLLKKIRALPPERQAEAERFIDFLRVSEERVLAAGRLAKAFAKLDAVGASPLPSQEVQAEIDAVRSERRARARRS